MNFDTKHEVGPEKLLDCFVHSYGSHFLRTLRSKPGSKDLQRILRSDPRVPIINNDLERDLRSDDHFLRSLRSIVAFTSSPDSSQ